MCGALISLCRILIIYINFQYYICYSRLLIKFTFEKWIRYNYIKLL